ncbi:MAG: GAF domain-containing protein, partial [Chloroflexota bacterium]
MSEKRTRGLGLTQTHPKRWRQWPRIIERRWRQEILEVAQASLHLTSSLELERVLESILAYALKLLAAYGAHIFLYDGSRLTFAAALWSDGRRGEPYALPREDGLTYQVARSGQRMVVPDVDHHSLFENYRWGGAIVGLPILLEGQVQGVMNVAFERPRHFDQDELWLLDLLAEQAANTLQNARLFAAERRQRQATETLREVTAALTSTLDLDQVLNSILGHLAKVVPYDSASVMLLEGDGLRVVAGRGFPDPARIEGAIFPAASPHFETLYQTQQAHFVPDVYLDDRFERWEGFEYIRGWMGVPLIARGQVIGCLTLDSRTVGAFGQAAAALAQGFANQAAVAIQNAQLFQESQRQARYATLVNKMIYEAAVARDLRTVLQTLADRMGQLLNADGCYITLWDEGRRKVIPAAASGQFAEIYPLLHTEPGEVTMTEAVLQNGRALAAEDVFHSPYVNQRVVALFPTHSLLALPFLAGAQKIGAALLAFDQPRHFTAEEIARGEQAASQIALALHRAQVLETLEQRVEQRTRELSRANEQLQELDRLKTRFMADVSHELRTPITNLGLYLSLLKQGKPEKQASYLQTLEQQVARLEQLVSAVLNLSRLEAGGGG